MPASVTPSSSPARIGHRSVRRADHVALTAGLGLLALVASVSSASAQYAASCPPPQKLVAGARVAACPAGYEDRGRECVFRSLSR